MGKRIAVLFGNNYAKYPENALRGCHNDVENMAHELLTAGMFREDEIVKYLDGGRESPENTRAGMIATLSALAVRTQTDDIELVYIHYSGHGDVIRVGHDKQAVKHHCILPSDFDDYRANDGVILDDWLAGWVMTMHERTRLVVIFDCCYSGSDLELHHSSIRKVTYISGCRDNQTSEDAIDIDDTYKYTGAMTTFMIQILKASPKTFNDTMLLHRDLCDRLRASGFSQVPVLTSTHSLVQDPIFIPARRRSTTSPVPNTTFFEKMF